MWFLYLSSAYWGTADYQRLQQCLMGLLFSSLVVPCRLGEEDHVPWRPCRGKRDHSRNSWQSSAFSVGVGSWCDIHWQNLGEQTVRSLPTSGTSQLHFCFLQMTCFSWLNHLADLLGSVQWYVKWLGQDTAPPTVRPWMSPGNQYCLIIYVGMELLP